MILNSAIGMMDPVNFHESIINFIPRVNEYSFLIKKTSKTALSALVSISGLFAAAREFVIGTARIFPWVFIRIPIGVIRCFKTDFAENLAKEHSFNQIRDFYLRGMSQLIGVAASITSLVLEVVLLPFNIGANQNYTLQVILGNVKADQRPLLLQKRENARQAAELAETENWKKRLGIDELQEQIKALSKENQESREVLTKLTNITKQLVTKMKSLEENQNPKMDESEDPDLEFVTENDFKDRMKKTDEEFKDLDKALKSLKNRTSENLLDMRTQINQMKQRIDGQNDTITQLGNIMTTHMKMTGALGDSFMDDSRLDDSRLDDSFDFGGESSIHEGSEEEVEESGTGENESDISHLEDKSFEVEVEE